MMFLSRPLAFWLKNPVFPGVFAQILVGAFDDDRVGALVDANELARALAHARAAGDALALIDLRNAEVVDFYRVKFAHAHAQPARHAAVFALCRRAAAAAAVRAVQQQAGLLVTGIVNRDTWAALQAQSCNCDKEE